jgi:hypothetical protein
MPANSTNDVIRLFVLIVLLHVAVTMEASALRRAYAITLFV